VVALLLLEKKQFVGCPPTVIDVGKQYLAHLSTTKGDCHPAFPDKAPMTVNSFVSWQSGVGLMGWPFTVFIPGFAAQTGDPSGTVMRTGYAFNDGSTLT